MGSSRPLLKAVALFELDQNKDTFWIWSYPSISASAKTSLQTKVAFESDEFVVIQLDEGWFYAVSRRGSSHKRVLAVTTVIQTNNFHPLKYRRLLDILSETYLKTNSPPELLKIYFMAQTHQSVERNGIALDLRNFPSPIEDVPIKKLIGAFQTETILIYTALLLKLRVMIYHHSVDELRQMVAAAASLMSHREDFFLNTYPLISNTEAEVSFLRGKASYLAGVTDASLGTRMDIMDLWVALPSREVIIAAHAKESLSRCKAHKEIALFMCRCSENSRLSDGDTAKEIAVKTRNLLSSVIKTVQERPEMSADKAIEGANLSPTLESFYKAIAKVEKIHN